VKTSYLFPIFQFTSSVWSGRENIILKESEEVDTSDCYTSTKFNKQYFTIRLPKYRKLPNNTSQYEKYRILRSYLWHEAQHGKYSPFNLLNSENLMTNSVNMAIYQIIEDKRVDTLGSKEYRGVKPELEYVYTLLFSKKDMIRKLLKRKKLNAAKILALSMAVFLGIESIEDLPLNKEKFRKALEIVNHYVENFRITPDIDVRRETFSYISKIKSTLDLQERTGQSIAPTPYRQPNEVSDEDRQKAKNYVKQKFAEKEEEEDEESEEQESKSKPKTLEDFISEAEESESEGRESEEEGAEEENEAQEISPKDVLEGRPEIKEKFEEAKRLEAKNIRKRKSEVDYKGFYRPRVKSTADYLYDKYLVQRLKRLLKDWKTGYKRVNDKYGYDLDIEAYINKKDKIFINHRVLGHKDNILLVLDHSGSITNYASRYKKAVVTLSEVLSYLGVNFAVTAFNSVGAKELYPKFWMLKPFRERWTIDCARKLASIRPDGGTPLCGMYERIMNSEKLRQPDHIITFTDGMPNGRRNDPFATKKMVEEYISKGTKMMGLAISDYSSEAIELSSKLENLSYSSSYAIDDLDKLPQKILDLILR